MPENNVECPQCGRLFRVPGELLGHRFRCLKCYTVFETSAPAASAAAFQAASAATALPHALALPQIGTPARHGPRRTRRRSSEPDEWWADPLMLVVGLLLVVWLGMAVLYVSVHWTPLFILLVLGGLSACVLGAIRLAQRRDSRAPYTGSAAAVVVGVGLLFGLFPVSLLADWVARQSSEPHGQADTVAQDQPSRFPPTAPPAPPDPLPPASPLFRHGSREYLSDLRAFGIRNGPWPVTPNGQVGDGHTAIRVHGKPSPKGIGMHPPDRPGYACAMYRLDGQAAVFKAGVALDDGTNFVWNGAVFEVWADGKQRWQSGVLKPAQQPPACQVDVRGVRVLILLVRAEGSHFGNHAVWLEPRLLQQPNSLDP